MSVHLYTNGAWTDSGKIYEKSLNLFDYLTMSAGIDGSYLDVDGNVIESSVSSISDYIPVLGGAFVLSKLGGVSPAVCLYDSNQDFIYGQAYNTGGGNYKGNIIVNTNYNAAFMRFSYFNETASPTSQDDLSQIMISSGISVKPFEPYGLIWKTNNGHDYSSGAWD